ncbi:MAG: type II secretion system protein [Verrucomicrobiales bacterium]
MKNHPRQFKNAACSRRGFTLVELLVVIAIIAVLVALAFVGARKAMDAATLAKGMSRVKGLQQANAAYAADNNGKFAIIWTTETDSRTGYGQAWGSDTEFLSHLTGTDVKGSFYNKNNTDERVLDPVILKHKEGNWWQIGVNFGYVIDNAPGRNWSAGGTTSESELAKDKHRRWSVQTVHDPSRMAAFLTSSDHLAKYSGRFKWRDNPGHAYAEGRVCYRYAGEKALAVFYDGHVETFTMADMEKIDADGGGRNNVFWGGKQYGN